MKRSVFNKVVLFTVLEYLEKQMKEKSTYQRDVMLQLLGQIKGYKTFARFSQEEANELSLLGSTPAIKKLREIEVDYSIYALELMALWVKLVPKRQRPHLNFSDSRILKLKSTLIMDMIRMKAQNADYAENVALIVSDSRLVAKKFIHLLDNEVAA